MTETKHHQKIRKYLSQNPQATEKETFYALRRLGIKRSAVQEVFQDNSPAPQIQDGQQERFLRLAAEVLRANDALQEEAGPEAERFLKLARDIRS